MHRVTLMPLLTVICFAPLPLARADDTPVLSDAQMYLSECQDDSSTDADGDAIDDCTAALKAGSLDASETYTAYLYRGMAHVDRNEDDAAIADVTEALAADPDHKDTGFAHYVRGLAYSGEQMNDKALVDFNEAIRLAPAEATYYPMRGVTYYRLGRNPEALADLSKGIGMDSKNAGAYSARSAVYLMQGDFGESIADSKQVLALTPVDDSARMLMGEAYYLQGQYPEALQTFDAALAKVPGDDAAMIWRYLAAQHTGADRDNILITQLDAMKDHGRWTHCLGTLFLGKCSRDTVLTAAAASTTDPAVQKQVLCQAKSLLGEFYFNNGHRDTAMGLFKEAAGVCEPNSLGRVLVQQRLTTGAAKKAKAPTG